MEGQRKLQPFIFEGRGEGLDREDEDESLSQRVVAEEESVV